MFIQWITSLFGQPLMYMYIQWLADIQVIAGSLGVLPVLVTPSNWRYECFRDIDLACATWEQILYDHPTDAFVARLLYNGYYHLGANESIRDSMARILPEWPKSRPLYGYLLGIYSFGLCETKDFEKAAAFAHKVCLQFPLVDMFFDSLLIL